MKKQIQFLAILLIASQGYSQAVEGTVEYQKKDEPAAVIEWPYAPSIVNQAMDEYLLKKGKSKGNSVKGFTIFRNTMPMTNDSSNADLYFKTERKSRKEKEITVVSLLVTPIETQFSSNKLHYLTMQEAKTYLDDLVAAIDSYNLELLIKDQNDAVIKAESKYKTLMEESGDLENKRSAIDKRISDNKNDQAQQLKEIDEQKQKLAQWVNQRRK
jgi:hypothetical protein